MSISNPAYLKRFSKLRFPKYNLPTVAYQNRLREIDKDNIRVTEQKDIKADVNPTPTPAKQYQGISNWKNKIQTQENIYINEAQATSKQTERERDRNRVSMLLTNTSK